MKIGCALYDLGNYSESLPWHMRAIKMDPYFVVAYIHLAKTFSAVRSTKCSLITYIVIILLLFCRIVNYYNISLTKSKAVCHFYFSFIFCKYFAIVGLAVSVICVPCIAGDKVAMAPKSSS